MVKYFSQEFFAELQDKLSNDTVWQEGTKGTKTSMKLGSTDQNNTQNFLLQVEDGKTTITPVPSRCNPQTNPKGCG